MTLKRSAARHWPLVYPRPLGATRHFLALSLCGIFFLAAPAPIAAQSLDKPSVNIDEDVSAFAFAPDGRIVYAVRRLFKNKKYDMQRDDIWIADSNGGRRHRIFQGEHFTVMKPFTPADSDSSEETEDTGKKGKRGKQAPSERDKPLTPPFTYLVEGFNFSPNGRMVLVGLLSSTMTAESSRAQDERMTLVLDESGREIKLSGDNAVIHKAQDATWLNDGQTIVYLTEAVEPNMLFSFRYANVKTGPAGPAFEGRTFIAAAPIPHSNSGDCHRARQKYVRPRALQRLDLLAQDDKDSRTLSTLSSIACATATPWAWTPSRSANVITLSTTSSKPRGFIENTSAPIGQAVARSPLETAHTSHRSWVITRSGASSAISSASTAYSEWLSETVALTTASISALDRLDTSIRVRATTGFSDTSAGQLQSSETPTSESSSPNSAIMSVALGSREMIRITPPL